MKPRHQAVRACLPLLASVAAIAASACADHPAGPGGSQAAALIPAGPPAILTETFDGLSGPAGSQCDTGSTVYTEAGLSGWTASGFHAAHGVVRYGKNVAATFYDTNALTLSEGVPANDAGIVYRVNFNGGPSVWNNCSEATGAEDGVVLEILRGDDTVLATHTHFPAAWVGKNTMTHAEFTYVGDGSGPVRIRLKDNLQNGRFGGAIDELVIRIGDPTNVGQCLNRGWRTYGFRRPADCVRYVVSGADARRGQ